MTTTARSVVHHTFTIERDYHASPARVFRAFAEQDARTVWFANGPGWDVAEYTLDFRVGGREVWRGGPAGGAEHRNYTVIYDIVPDERIVWAYEMYVEDTRISVSVVTIQLARSGAGTRLTFTEQGAFLDGSDDGSMREHGTRELLASLDSYLRGAPTAA